MKIKILILAAFLIPIALLAQTTQTEVVPGGGGESQNATYKNFGTFGQPSASESSNSEYKNNEGFLQAQAPSVPTVTTSMVSNINVDSARSGGEIIYHGGMPITASGIIFSTSPNAQVGDVGVTVVLTDPVVDESEFSLKMTGLINGTTYYVRAFAQNEVGYGYGDDVQFVSIPTLGEIGSILLVLLIAGFGGYYAIRKV
jgi:hypothetical protein